MHAAISAGGSPSPTTATGRVAVSCPTLIEWSDARHPTDALPDSGVQSSRWRASIPSRHRCATRSPALGLSETLKVTYGRTPRLAAMLRTPRGVVTL